MNEDFDLLTDGAGQLVFVGPDGARHENVRPMRIFRSRSPTCGSPFKTLRVSNWPASRIPRASLKRGARL